MSGRFPGFGVYRLDNLKSFFIDDMHDIPVFAEEHVDPGVGGVFVAAHEKART